MALDYESGGKLYNYIMRQSEPVEIRVNLDYIANVETGLTLFAVVQEVKEDGVSFDEVYYDDSYYVTAGTENEIDYGFYFIISSEDIKDAKAIRLDITDLDDLTLDDETYTISIPLTSEILPSLSFVAVVLFYISSEEINLSLHGKSNYQ